MSAKVFSLNVQPARPDHKPPPITDDPIFFHKSNIEVGTRLNHKGRLDPNSRWSVVKIESSELNPAPKRGEPIYRTRRVREVHKLSDVIYLQRVGGKEVRSMTFSYLSYSAIWRLSEA